MPEKINKKSLFTVIASSASDILVDKSLHLIKTQKGGPLYYIKKVLKEKKICFDTIPLNSFEVEIMIDFENEFGKIEKKPKIKRVKYTKITSPNLIISTILDEILLSGIENYSGRVFIDLQGFVRNGNSFGEKKKWLIDKKISNSFFCVKGTEEELNYISKGFFNNQKNKILIITKGRKGGTIFAFGKKYNYKPDKLIALPNTIGAGDVFFSHFASCYAKSGKISKSIQMAREETEKFLLNLNK